ncbi:MAG: transposase [Nitrosomonas sp.]|nr:transposase [Nitrosomonas sp.]
MEYLLTPLIKQLTKAALAVELEQHIKSGNEQNRKNGSTPKTVKSTSGSFQLDTPRDRNGTIGNIPPAEFEMAYYRRLERSVDAA